VTNQRLGGELRDKVIPNAVIARLAHLLAQNRAIDQFEQGFLKVFDIIELD
jgi:hypothetical protein